MKKFYLLFILFIAIDSKAQIIINSADLPSVNDTFRLSKAPINTPVDLTLTGANYTWDFSHLSPAGQSVDSFISVAATDPVYSVYFGSGINAANLVEKGPFSITLGSTPASPYGFYNTSNTDFRQVGYGAVLDGVTTPIVFDYHDIIYSFPVAFGNFDSCNAHYNIITPGLSHEAITRHRENYVDGWGTIITPYGHFDVLRVVSEISVSDCYSIVGLPLSYNIIYPLMREYKWLAKDEGIPVMQINTEFINNVETITSIAYKDSLFITGLTQVKTPIYGADISPNPSKGDAKLKCKYSGNGSITILVTELSGKAIGKITVSNSELQNGVELDQYFRHLPDGVFILHLRGESGTEIIRWVRQR